MAYGALISTRIASALLMMGDDLVGRLKALVKQEQGAAGEQPSGGDALGRSSCRTERRRVGLKDKSGV